MLLSDSGIGADLASLLAETPYLTSKVGMLGNCGKIAFLFLNLVNLKNVKSRQSQGGSLMLIEFTVENYLSWQSECSFSLVAKRESRQMHTAKPYNLLKVAVIYGNNASGKSNLLRAWDFMRQLVLTSTVLPLPLPRLLPTPFKLATTTVNQPSTFNVRFLTQQTIYEYGFIVDLVRVHGEWLYTYPKGRKCLLFERETHLRTGEIRTHFGSFWKGEKQKLHKLVRPDALLLSVAAQFNSPTATLVWQWFHNLILLTDNHLLLTPAWVIAALTYSKTTLKRLLQQADPSIQDLMIEVALTDTTSINAKDVSKNFNNLNKDLSLGGRTSDFGAANQVEISLLHRGTDDQDEPKTILLELAEQAAGTKKYLQLLFPLLAVFRRGGVLIVDDLTNQLHSELVMNILQMCYSEEFNAHNAQLIFTSRDCYLLNSPLLQREQIWLVEKNSLGATVLRNAGEK
jgi:uncharacterized protein